MNKEWNSSTKIILGIDIGTTYSAASFAYLIQGQIPKVTRVTKWPGQRGASQQCSIPSWIWYDAEGEPVKIGAEANDDDVCDYAPELGWELVKHFKLHLHPRSMAPPGGFKLPTLPNHVKVEEVYFHFLRYMFKHIRCFFQNEVFNGTEVWDQYASSMDVVITHPNGWGPYEQQKLRSASIKAGLSSNSKPAPRIELLSEGEASIHFCIDSLDLHSSVKPGAELIVCDAGGSTVDTTAYRVTSVHPKLKLEEVKASACIQAGSIFVDEAAMDHIYSALKSAELSEDEFKSYTRDGTQSFVELVKPEYDGEKPSMRCKIGEKKLNISQINILNGRMQLSGATIKSFFDPCVDRILESAVSQAKNVNSPHLFLVGGFGDSLYLQKAMKDCLNASTKFTTNNKPGSKAVADGAVIWAISRNVTSRAARYSYGLSVSVPYDSSDPEHNDRKIFLSPRGLLITPGGWSEIIAKDTVMNSDSVIKMPYHRPYSVPRPTLSDFSTVLYSTTLPGNTQFMKDKDGSNAPGFHTVCTISADMHELEGHLSMKLSPLTGVFWELKFIICIRFGGTELMAYIEWADKEGNIHKGKASTIVASVV